MDDLEREKKQGFDWDYMADVLEKKAAAAKYQIPGFGLGAALFAFVAKAVIKELGEEKGEALLKKAIDDFGKARGRRIAAIVKDLGTAADAQELADLQRHRLASTSTRIPTWTTTTWWSRPANAPSGTPRVNSVWAITRRSTASTPTTPYSRATIPMSSWCCTTATTWGSRTTAPSGTS